mmetsp:Transcript_28397/g.90499  ORF Transcript_28397/g.90499 Transcript_28397/m.90499 type:complete len:99 (+) Transcript_28397:428-724(+)
MPPGVLLEYLQGWVHGTKEVKSGDLAVYASARRGVSLAAMKALQGRGRRPRKAAHSWTFKLDPGARARLGRFFAPHNGRLRALLRSRGFLLPMGPDAF